MNTSSHIFTFLRDVSGLENANIDASTTMSDFYFEAPRRCWLSRFIVNIYDEGTFDTGSYGNGLPLSNGLIVLLKLNGVEYPLTDMPIKTNVDWGNYCYDVGLSDFGGGDKRLGVRWSFFKSGKEVRLRRGDRLIVRIADDLRELSGHYFHVQGHF